MDTYYIDTVEDVQKIAKMLDDINTPINKNNTTLLHFCSIMSSDTEPIEYLLDIGANPYQVDIFGLNSFDYAKRNKNTIAGLLIYNTLK
jgi:ankyrin repeat protein